MCLWGKRIFSQIEDFILLQHSDFPSVAPWWASKILQVGHELIYVKKKLLVLSSVLELKLK